MISYNSLSTTATQLNKRRQLLKSISIAIGGGLLPLSLSAQVLEQLLTAASQAEVKAEIDLFLKGATPLEQGLKLIMPVLGDNPAAVPVKVAFEAPITPDSYCEELILLAEGNPRPLACRFTFTALAGTSEVAVRLRLIESQRIQAIARMNDGRFLIAKHHITVTAGGCGM